MKLSRLFDEDRVVQNVAATTALELIDATLAGLPDGTFQGTTREEVHRILAEREEAGSLVVQGVLLPHARIEGLAIPFIAVGVPQEAFEALSLVEPDKTEEVLLAMVVVVPKQQNTLMLQTMAAIQRLLAEEPASTLASIRSPAKLIRHIEDSGIDVKKVVMAADIMSPETAFLSPEMPLAEAVRALVAARAEVAVVQDAEGNFLGEVNALDILAVGIPKHLGLLPDPSLLDQFEAFEKYFESEGCVTVGAIMKKDVPVAAPTESIMQVSQRLIKTRAAKVYVLQGGKLLGAIRPRDVVLRVLGV